ncbi:unnamed protein product [Paramecium sonneborni]|uniref:Uncharacterized protein n=1 Tax=Paramecium sonneborni TaxID=65129 RepID=A0A8S1Q1J7_9CILI|nr:unnamed protein product [Paramecium sonneborni]
MIKLQENLLQTALKLLNELHSEILRILIQLDKSDSICEKDEYSNRKQFQSIAATKYYDQFDDLDLKMNTMSKMFNQYIISPEEAQARLKNNILRSFKEKHQVHKKKVLKLQVLHKRINSKQ